jgi:integrase
MSKTHAPLTRRRTEHMGPRGRCLRSLNQLLRAHNAVAARSDKRVGWRTQKARRQDLVGAVNDLHDSGYRLEDVRNLRPRHVAALVRLWESRGWAPAYLQRRVSSLRTLAAWIGKPGLVGDVRTLLADPACYARTYTASEDRSWEGRGVDVEAKLRQVQEKDPAVHIQLLLAHAFGLRTQEAVLLQPHDADRGDVLAVSRGTKGGRKRQVPIESSYQREVLAQAKALASLATGSTIPDGPPAYTLKRWLNRYYYVLRGCGITRKDGIVAHGLRHGYANRRYEALAGVPSPVRGGTPETPPEPDARERLAEELGHSRPQVTNAYCGR